MENNKNDNGELNDKKPTADDVDHSNADERAFNCLFLFKISLETAALGVAYSMIILSVLLAILFILFGSFWPFLIFLFLILTCQMLIFGVKRRRPDLMIPYLVFTVIIFALHAAFTLYISMFYVSNLLKHYSYGDIKILIILGLNITFLLFNGFSIVIVNRARKSILMIGASLGPPAMRFGAMKDEEKKNDGKF